MVLTDASGGAQLLTPGLVGPEEFRAVEVNHVVRVISKPNLSLPSDVGGLLAEIGQRRNAVT